MYESVLDDDKLVAIEERRNDHFDFYSSDSRWTISSGQLIVLRDDVPRLVAEVRRLREALRTILERGESFSLNTKIEGEQTDCYGCQEKMDIAEIALNGWLG